MADERKDLPPVSSPKFLEKVREAWDLYLAGKWQGKVFVPVIDFIFRPWMTEHCRKSWAGQVHLYESKQ